MLGLALLDWLIIIAFVLLSLGLGFWSRTRIHSAGDFFLGNRTFGKVLMVAQAFGSGTHTAQPVSVAGASYTAGLSGIWYQWLWLFATPFFWLLAPLYRRLRYLTVADYYHHRYGGGMALVYTIFGLLYFCMNIGLVLKGAGTLIEGMSAGAIPPVVSILFITVVFSVYGVSGGLHAVVRNDLIQSFFTLVMSFLIIPYALVRAGGLASLHSGLPPRMFDLVTPGELSPYFIAMIGLSGLVGVVVHPHHMAMNGSGRTELACRLGWTGGTLLKRFTAIGWAFIGVLAAFLFPGLVYENRELAFGLAARQLLPVGMVGLMLTSFLAAGMSTCDGFMVHASALLTRNIYVTRFNPAASENQQLRVARYFSFAVVAGGILFAFAFTSVVGGMLALLKVCSFLGISFWAGLFWKRANRYGAAASLLVMAAAVLFSEYVLHWPLEDQTALYLALGVVTMVIVSVCTRPEPAQTLREFYLLLDTPVGLEARLKEAGVPVILPGAPAGPGPSPEDGLLLVDLLSLRRSFNYRRYRTDLIGFLLAAVLVIFLVVLVQLLAHLGG